MKKSNAPKALSAREDVKPEDVTEHQYSEAWKLYSAGTPERDICRATGISVAQFKYMHGVGGPKGMMSFLSRERLDDAILHEQRQQAIQAFGEGLSDTITRHKRHANTLLKVSETLLATYVEHVVKPAMTKMRDSGDPSYLSDIVMPTSLESNLKSLSKLAVQHDNAAGDLVNKMIKATTKDAIMPSMFGAPDSVARPASIQRQVEEAAAEGSESLRALLPEGLVTPEAIAEFLVNHRMPDEAVDEETEDEAESD